MGSMDWAAVPILAEIFDVRDPIAFVSHLVAIRDTVSDIHDEQRK